MGTCGHQIGMGREIEDRAPQKSADNQHMVQLSGGFPTAANDKGKNNFQETMNINLQYNELTDVMFVDILPIADDSHVDVIDIGEKMGFSGQIQIRVDMDKQIFYGLTIQNYSGFKRKLMWRYRMWSIQSALRFLITILLAGLNVERNGQRHVLAG